MAEIARFITVTLWAIMSLCTDDSDAQQPYVRTWDRMEIERSHKCNELLYYRDFKTEDLGSICSTVRQQNNNNCNSIKGYPSYKDTLERCRRMGK